MDVTDTATRQEPLDGQQRQLLLGIGLAAVAVSAVPSTYNFILNPMLVGLDASESQESFLRQLPSIAALLVIFVGASVGTRFGERRLIFASALAFTFGCALVGLAPALPIATVGLVLISASTSVMAVVGLGLVSSYVKQPQARATAFATIALVAPAVYMALPVVAGFILDHWSWRLVTLVWLLTGLAATWGSRSLLPPDGQRERKPELLTPALAGLALAATVQTISAISTYGAISTQVGIRAATALVSGALLSLSYRRSREHSISAATLRRGGVLLLLVVVLLVPFVNLWYYMTLAYQYVFAMTALQTAILLVPAQLAGVFGALIARKFIQLRGITFTGIVLLIVLAASLALSALIESDTSVLAIIVVMSVYALASVGAGVAVTNSIMNAAAPGEDSNASAFRGAAMHIGTAVGVVVMSAIVFGAMANSLDQSLGNQGLTTSQSQEIAASIRDGASSEDVSAQFAVPVTEVDQIDAAQQDAMMSGLRAQGIAGAVVILAAVGFFGIARRRQVAPTRQA